MNDWLDYPGSGSSRAYIAHYGVKGMKWDPSKLFGKPQETDKRKMEIASVKANDIHKKITEAEGDSAAISRSRRIKQSYSGTSADEFIEHASWVPVGSNQYDADYRLINAYAEKMKKLKSEYKTLLNDYNRSIKSYHNNMRKAESQESKRAEIAKSGHALTATQSLEKFVWMHKKQASDAKDEAISYLTKMKANVDSQKKLQEDVKSIDNSDYQYSLERSRMAKMKTNSLFIPDELPSNVNQIIKQSYFDMPADEFIMHTEKGGTSMNDWLDYQGSGSSRAYADGRIEGYGK